MAGLSDLPAELWHLTTAVFKELLNIWRTPWRFHMFREEVGAPESADWPGLFARMEALVDQEYTAESLDDVLGLIDGFVEAIRLANETPGGTGEALALAFDIVSRMALPIVLYVAKREPTLRSTWWKLLVLLPMLDRELAQHLPQGYLGTRVAALAEQGLAQLFQNEDDQLALGIVLAVYATAVALDEIFGSAELLSTEHWDALWGLGFESDRPAWKVGVPQPAPDDVELPLWLAQRTVSMRWERKQDHFTLEDYTNAPKFDEIFERPRSQRPVIGLTIVPIPTVLGGPDVFVQLDGAASLPDTEIMPRVWRRIRGDADVGVRIPLGDRKVGPTTGAGFSVEVSYVAPEPAAAPEPTSDGGTQGGVSLDIGGAALVLFAGYSAGRAAVSADDLGLAVRVQKARLTLTPKSRVLGELVKRSFTVSLDAGLMFSHRAGWQLEGSGGLELYVALRQQLGNRWAGMEVSYARIGIQVERGDDGSRFTLLGTVGVTFNFMRMSLILDGIGGRMTLDTGERENGNLLRLGNLEGDLVTPNGYGLKIDWGGVRGGGFFKYEPAIERFSGVVELALTPKYTLRGVGFTQPREGGGTTTLVSVTFEYTPPAPSPWFTPTGIGVLVGLHRRGDGDAMRAALPTGGMDALMFPPDPLGRSGELVAALATMFPETAPDDDGHVVGLMLRGLFAAGRVEAKLGLLYEWGSGASPRSKLYVAVSVKTTFPATLDRVLHIEIVGLGEYDFASGDFDIRAQLRNSRLCGGDLEGGAIVFRGDPDLSDADPNRGVFASLGGYHPGYFGGLGPQRVRVDKRLRIVMERANAIKLEVALYIAMTPSAFHFGLRGHLEVKAGGFGVDGQAWLDGFIDWKWDDYKIEVGGSLDLMLFDRTVAALELVGRLTGSHPWQISGKVSFKVLWWSVSKSFCKNLSDEEGTSERSIDVNERFLDTVVQAESYAAQRPADVTITSTQRSGIWNAPEQPLRFFQKEVPLDTRIERIGPTPLPKPASVHVDHVTIAGKQHTPPPAVGEFAPGLYLSLDKDAALRAPVAEHWPAGFDAAGDEVASGDDHEGAAKYDEIIVDREYREPPVKPPKRVIPPHVLATLLTPSAPVNVPIRIARPAYVTATGASTFANAWAERGRFVRRVEGS